MRTTVMLAVSMALGIPAVASAQATSALQPGETLLQVTATGSVTAIPDMATIRVGVASTAPTSAGAGKANAEQAQRLLRSLQASGIPDSAIRTSAVSLQIQHGRDKDGDTTDRIVGYQASNMMTVRLSRIEQTSAVIDALIAAGATDVQGPEFSFADDAPLLAKARAYAVRRAHIQAADYAMALGLSVARPIRVSERSAFDSGEGAGDIIVTGNRRGTPISPGEQKVQVTVWIDYALTHR